MEEIDNKISLIRDEATREALKLIANELRRIKNVKPVQEGNNAHAYAINSIIGRL